MALCLTDLSLHLIPRPYICHLRVCSLSKCSSCFFLSQFFLKPKRGGVSSAQPKLIQEVCSMNQGLCCHLSRALPRLAPEICQRLLFQKQERAVSFLPAPQPFEKA